MVIILYKSKANNIILRDYEDFSLIYNISANKYAKIDNTASKIIHYIIEKQIVDINDIVDYLKNLYQTDDINKEDIENFLNDLYKAQLIGDCNTALLPHANEESLEDDEIEDEIMQYMLSKRQLFSATIEMTYHCNEHCIHCYAYDGQFSKQKLLTTDELKMVIDQLYDMNCFHIVFTGGDPFMRKDFVEIFEYARQKNFSVDIYTNGLILSENDEIFDRIVAGHPKGIYISLYSSDPNIHNAITTTNDSWNKTINAIKKLHKAHISVVLNINVMKNTVSTLNQTIILANTLGVNYRIGWSMTETNTGSSSPLKYVLEDEKEAIQAIQIASNKKQLLDIANQVKKDDYICGVGITSLTITPTGDVKPCVSLNINYGNIKHKSLKDIFYSNAMTSFVCDITWKNTTECKNCEYMNICHHCVANSYNQTGSVLSSNNQDCFFAKCLSKAVQ